MILHPWNSLSEAFGSSHVNACMRAGTHACAPHACTCTRSHTRTRTHHTRITHILAHQKCPQLYADCVCLLRRRRAASLLPESRGGTNGRVLRRSGLAKKGAAPQPPVWPWLRPPAVKAAFGRARGSASAASSRATTLSFLSMPQCCFVKIPH